MTSTKARTLADRLPGARWGQAFLAGAAAPVVLAATHERALEVVSLEWLREHAVDVPDDAADLD